ncbi:MAG: HTH domain-containing protein [Nitrospirae bacterium]|nr:HTH domain-containing protein [Nitrospirota bacterium]
MKIKRVRIEIKRLDDALKEAGEVFEKLSRGEHVQKKTAIYFSNLKEMRKVLTERRLELLKAIKDKKPVSVYELAKMVGRDIKNVLQDIAYLQELGLVEITETKDKKVPRVDYDKIAFEVAI